MLVCFWINLEYLNSFHGETVSYSEFAQKVKLKPLISISLFSSDFIERFNNYFYETTATTAQSFTWTASATRFLSPPDRTLSTDFLHLSSPNSLSRASTVRVLSEWCRLRSILSLAMRVICSRTVRVSIVRSCWGTNPDTFTMRLFSTSNPLSRIWPSMPPNDRTEIACYCSL